MEITLLNRRKTYIDTLFTEASNKQLSAKLKLAGNTADPTSYCPTDDSEGCNPVTDTSPPAKALAWARGKGLDTTIKNKWKTALTGVEKSKWKDFTTISKLWAGDLVGSNSVPPYRLTNTNVSPKCVRVCACVFLTSIARPNHLQFLQGAKYTSSAGGEFLVRYALKKLANTAPSVDFALFGFGALMTAQPFPDGNKRAARALYVLTMNARTPAGKFKAPSNTFGGVLADM
jgi:hypothetical protein